jgi:hypothetical protein
LCALLTMYRLAQATTHSAPEATSPSITPHHSAAQAIHTIHTHPPHTLKSCTNPTAELVQVEISGGSTKDGGSITTGDTPAYPTPLPIFVLVSDFLDNNSNPLDMLAVNSHTAMLGKTGGGKTHLACHLIIQWAPIKGWNHGWVVAIMPRLVRNRPHAAHQATQSQPPCRQSRHTIRTPMPLITPRQPKPPCR